MWLQKVPMRIVSISCRLGSLPCQPKTDATRLVSSLTLSIVPRFLPPPHPRRGLVHTVCACAKYPVIFFVKSFVHFLVRMRKIILTKNTEFSLLDSSEDLTCRTLLGYYISDVEVSFFQTYSPTER